MRASTSLPSHACLNALTRSACCALGVVGACAASMRWRADDASWRDGRRTADHLGDLGERVAEDVVQDERDPFGRRHRFEDDEECHVDRLVQGDPVGGVGDRTTRAPGDPVRRFGQRLGYPFTDVALPSRSCRAELVEADATDDGGQPRARVLDGSLLWRGQRGTTGLGLLHCILGVGERPQHSVGDVEQLVPLADDRAESRIDSTRRGSNSVVTSAAPWVSFVPSTVRRSSAPNCEVCVRPDVAPRCVVGVCTQLLHVADGGPQLTSPRFGQHGEADDELPGYCRSSRDRSAAR